MSHEGLRSEVREFLAVARASGAFVPHCDAWMTGFDPAFSRSLAERGWIGMTWPREYGGAERSEGERLAVVEELLAAGAPVAAHWFADRQIGPCLLRNGTPELRARYLPRIAAGRCFFAVGMSEPDSGSDLASIRTSARRTGSGWVVNGTKVWTSHAHRAHVMLALVRTSPPDPQRRHAGLSQLLIDLTAAGVHVRPIMTLDGQHHFNEVVLTDVEVGADALLGTEGRGWQQVTAELANERSGPERYLSNLPLLSAFAGRDDIPAAELGELVAELQTLRSLSAAVADALGRGASPTVAAALVKDLGSRFERKVLDTARRLAPAPLDAGSPDEYTRLLTEAVLHSPDATLRGGTNEILRGIVGRELTRP
jgi:alkylation response protein AidB-like acyl-CoA dehydrogenase